MIFIIIQNVRSHQFLPVLYTDSMLQEGGRLLMKPIVACYSDDRIVRSGIQRLLLEDVNIFYWIEFIYKQIIQNEKSKTLKIKKKQF